MSFDTGEGEKIARFITQSNHFSPSKKIVRHVAFMPPKATLRLSIYWTTGLSEEVIWEIGAQFVAPTRPVRGRADLNSLVVCNEAELTIDVTGQPHPRHANIVGWDADEKKLRHQAQKLADKAALVTLPE